MAVNGVGSTDEPEIVCELRSLGHEQDAARLRHRVVQARTADEWQGLEPQPAIVAADAGLAACVFAVTDPSVDGAVPNSAASATLSSTVWWPKGRGIW